MSESYEDDIDYKVDTVSTQKPRTSPKSTRISQLNQRILYVILIFLILFTLSIAMFQTKVAGSLRDENDSLQRNVINLKNENKMLQATIEALQSHPSTP